MFPTYFCPTSRSKRDISADLAFSLLEDISLNSIRSDYIPCCISDIHSIIIREKNSASEICPAVVSGSRNGPKASFLSLQSHRKRCVRPQTIVHSVVAIGPQVWDGVSLGANGEATSMLPMRGISSKCALLFDLFRLWWSESTIIRLNPLSGPLAKAAAFASMSHPQGAIEQNN
jgi:hypothetical protein